jgi:DUF1680 family protein
VSRREVLATLATGALAALAAGAMKGCGTVSAQETASARATAVPQKEELVQLAVTSAVRSFDLADVRLLEGPFLQAQKRDEKYLLELEPDRMLHNFRVNAGLPPKAPVYAGWESAQTWADIRCHGHTLGHYLSACAMMYASTGDERFKQRCDTIVTELQECQTAGKTGLICAFPDGAEPFAAIAAGRRFPGVIWYTMHKIFAGLRDTYVFTGNKAALEVLTKLADFALDTTKNLTDAQFQQMLGVEHGGMNEVLGDVYALTGEKKYLTLAERFCHHTVMDPLAQGRDTLGTLHSNTQIPKFVGFNRLYALTGKADYLAASKFFWETVTRNRSFVTGGNGDNEHFFPPQEFPRHLSSAKTMETCCSHNMLRLTRMLFALEPSAAYGDYYERTLYNCILASQDPDSGMMTYFQPLRPGYPKIFCTPTESFWCCTGTGIENHAKYGDSIYFRGNGALYVNLFIASQVRWKDQGVMITQNTTFPETPRTQLKIAAKSPADFTLHIRHPAWCPAVTVKVNGRDQATSDKPGSYIAVKRTWREGDVVDVELPMALRTELLPGTTDTVALVYGPIVLAGKLGQQGLRPGADIIINERTIGSVLNSPVEVPALVGEVSQIPGLYKPAAGSALTFTVEVPGRPEGLTFVPYYRMAHERYSIYWKVAAKA